MVYQRWLKRENRWKKINNFSYEKKRSLKLTNETIARVIGRSDCIASYITKENLEKSNLKNYTLHKLNSWSTFVLGIGSCLYSAMCVERLFALSRKADT